VFHTYTWLAACAVPKSAIGGSGSLLSLVSVGVLADVGGDFAVRADVAAVELPARHLDRDDD
jgi:hypothetical protein